MSLWHSCRGPIALAVVGRAEVGSTLHDLAGDRDSLQRRIEAVLALASAWVLDGAAGVRELIVRHVPVAWSIPRRCRSCRAGRSRWPGTSRPVRCPRSRRRRCSGRETRPARCWPSTARRGELVTPGVGGAVQPAAGGELPLGLGGQRLSRPVRIGLDVGPGDVHDGMVRQTDRRELPGPAGAASSLPARRSTSCTGCPVDRWAGWTNTDRRGNEQARASRRGSRRVRAAARRRSHTRSRRRTWRTLGW